MASENETVAEVLAEFGKNIELMRKCRCVGVSLWNCLKCKLRIEAAHQREVAELKHWIKSSARWIKCHDIYHTSGDDLIKQAKEILNDNGEFLFKKEEQ